jgi:hypothetical protein
MLDRATASSARNAADAIQEYCARELKPRLDEFLRTEGVVLGLKDLLWARAQSGAAVEVDGLILACRPDAAVKDLAPGERLLAELMTDATADLDLDRR